MKKIVVLIVWAIVLIANANAFDVKLLANNKEAFSRELTRQDESRVDQWSHGHPLGEEELKARAVKSLSDTFNEMERIDTNCEVGLIARLQADAVKHEIITSEKEVVTFISYLRRHDFIDDILFKLMRDSAKISVELAAASETRLSGHVRNTYTRQNSGVDLEKLYAPVKTWPDDIKKCSLDTYYHITQDIKWNGPKDRYFQMQKLNYQAVTKGVISVQVFNKLEILRKRSVLSWPIYFKRYADVINNAKDKLTKNPELKATNDFTAEYVSRKQGITQRGNLYATYSSTQVMMLAQIIEKTAKRMDSRLVTLNWQYTDDPNGETQVYIFSPMEQYRAAIKMLRKDMAEVMRSDAFKGTGLEYSHLIAAAYETGYIRSEELDYILKFEDFWNPKIPKWKTYANFAFSLAGTATFYLPPPWNIIGAIGLVFAQGKYVYGDPEADPDDNWNVII